MRCWLMALAGSALLLVWPALAEDAAPAVPSTSTARAETAPGSYKTSDSGTLQLTIYLGLMLALFAGGAFLLRNGFTLFQPKFKGERKLEISETRMLGNRQFLVVATYEDRKVLLGVCPGRIDYLCSLAAAEAEFPNIAPEKGDE